MNESKVVVYGVMGKHLMVFDEADQADRDSHSMNRMVTHADYKALEEQRDKFKALWDQTEACLLNSMEELAYLKARVGELVESAKHLIGASAVDETGCHCTSNIDAAVYECNSALEALK